MDDLTELLDAFEGMDKSGHGSRMSYIGDKQKYLPLLLGIVPDYETLTEPYGGMAAFSRLALIHDEADARIEGGLHRRRRIVYGDLNADNINLLTIIRDDGDNLAKRLAAVVNDGQFYEHARANFRRGANPLDRATMYLVNLNSSHHAHRIPNHRSGYVEKGRLEELPKFIEIYSKLFQNMVIEQSDSFDLIRKYDSPTTLHFVDPCYVSNTRKHGSTRYAIDDNDDEHHRRLCEVLVGCEGKVIPCGYPTPIYDEYFDGHGWENAGPLNIKFEMIRTNGKVWQPEMIWTNFPIDDAVREELLKNYRQGGFRMKLWKKWWSRNDELFRLSDKYADNDFHHNRIQAFFGGLLAADFAAFLTLAVMKNRTTAQSIAAICFAFALPLLAVNYVSRQPSLAARYGNQERIQPFFVLGGILFLIGLTLLVGAIFELGSFVFIFLSMAIVSTLDRDELAHLKAREAEEERAKLATRSSAADKYGRNQMN